MPAEKQSTDKDEPTRMTAPATGESVPVGHGPAAASDHRPTRKRKLLLFAIGVLVLAAVAAFGIPYIHRTSQHRLDG